MNIEKNIVQTTTNQASSKQAETFVPKLPIENKVHTISLDNLRNSPKSSPSPLKKFIRWIKSIPTKILAILKRCFCIKSKKIDEESKNLELIQALVMPPKYKNENNNCWFHSALELLWGMGPDFSDLVDKKIEEVKNLKKIDNEWQQYFTPDHEILLNSLKDFETAMDSGNRADLYKAKTKIQAASMKLFPTLKDLGRQQDSGEFLNEIFSFLTTPLFQIETTVKGLGDLAALSQVRQPNPDNTLKLYFHNETSLQKIIDANFSAKKFDAPTTINDVQVPAYEEKQKILSEIPPNFLLVMLIRFDHQNRKIDTPVEMPDNNLIDFSRAFGLDKADPTYQYALHGTIIHEEISEDIAHYTSTVLGIDPKNGKQAWYRCNDVGSRVDQVNSKQLKEINKNAYLFLFKRIKCPNECPTKI